MNLITRQSPQRQGKVLKLLMTAYNMFSGLVRLLSTFCTDVFGVVNNALLFGLVGKQTLLQVDFGDVSPHIHAFAFGQGTGSRDTSSYIHFICFYKYHQRLCIIIYFTFPLDFIPEN